MISWTALYGQTGSQDTLTCYTNEELQKIAIRVVKASELDTVLKLTQQELINQNNIISKQMDQLILKDEVIMSKDTIISKHDKIIDIKNGVIEDRDKEITKLNNQKKWLKTGWVGSVAVMIVTILFVAI